MTDTESTPNLDAIIARINKIMALAGNNPSEAEAASAAEKVQALLAKYQLDEQAVRDAGIVRDDPMVINDSIVSDMYPWRMLIGAGVARLYFCAYYRAQRLTLSKALKTSTKGVHVFVGTKANTTVAALMFDYLCKAVERLAREGALAKPENERSPYRTTFRQTCAARLEMRLTERARAAAKGEIKEVNDAGEATGRNLPALLPVMMDQKAKVDAFMEEKQIKPKTKNIKVKNLHDDGKRDGWAAGDKISLDQQVGGTKSSGAIGDTKRIGKA